MVAALQRIAAETIDIEAGTADNQDMQLPLRFIHQPFQIIAPGTVFVYLVKDEPSCGRQFPAQDGFAVSGHIPIEIETGFAGNLPRHGRLADLAGAGHKNHFPAQVGVHLFSQVACFHEY